MGRQPYELGDSKLDALIERCERGLRSILGTTQADVLLLSANGHGGWESTIANLVPIGGQVLVVGTGPFSDLWAAHAERLGVRALRTESAEGAGADASAIESALRSDVDRQIVAVLVCHTDTACGVTADLRAVRSAMDAAQHSALLVVDVVASLGACPFSMDELGANVVIGASQKALMGPSGLSFVAVDARAMAIAKGNPTPRFYWDWNDRKGAGSYRKFCGTPPQSLLMGLDAALKLIESEGLDNIFRRHRLFADAVQAAVARWSQAGAIDFHVRSAHERSVSVTAVELRGPVNPEVLRDFAREHFDLGIAGGIGPLAGRVFRIGHLGDINVPTILGCIATLEAAMLALRIPYGAGGVESAVRVLSQSVPVCAVRC